MGSHQSLPATAKDRAAMPFHARGARDTVPLVVQSGVHVCVSVRVCPCVCVYVSV